MPEFAEIETLVRENLGEEADLDLLRRAYEYAAEVHAETVHVASGKPYIAHLLAVTHILASMRLDLHTVVAGLLHGSLKEEGVTLQELTKRFGNDVAGIVSGASRLTNVRFNSKLAYQAENIRKLLLAMASDVRVLLVRLADRLHDIRSLTASSLGQRQEVARETMDLYAPLASRLGIDWMKRELEDLAFKYLHPEEYEELLRQVESTSSERREYVDRVIHILEDKLRENHLTGFRIIGRPKHLYSIYKKTVVQNIPVDRVYDKVAFRVLVPEIKECYEVLGVVHANWAPVPGRFRDFISSPKSNNYRSLHTTVVGPQGKFMEVQIRTEEMDRVAQEGIAAHWAYKEGMAISRKDAKAFQWLKQLVQWLQELKDPREFLDSVKVGLDEAPDVYAVTPNGEVKEFVQGSTPIDFAYAIHTEVGNHCVGAKVNGRIVSLKYQLQNGDMVEIITSPKQRPRRGWLPVVQTSRAKSRIRQWLRREEWEQAINVGREICERELRKYDTSLKKIIKTGHFKQLLKALRCNTLEDLLGRVGSGTLTIQTVLKELQPEEMRVETVLEEEQVRTTETVATRAARREHTAPRAAATIMVEGADDLLVKISHCCLPVPGDEIMGFITTGRGISIHKAACPNFLTTDPQRRIEVNWSEGVRSAHRAHVQVVAQNVKGMLASLSAEISNQDADIVELNARTSPENLAVTDIVVEVRDLDHLQSLLQRLRQVEGVIDARRK